MSEGIPVRQGSQEAFQTVRNFLIESGYTEQALLERFKIPTLHYLLYPLGQQGKDFDKVYTGQGHEMAIARFLFGGYSLSEEEMAQTFPSSVREALVELGLAVRMETGNWGCPVLLFPWRGVYAASDRSFAKTPLKYVGKDYTMSGLEYICQHYMNTISMTQCERFLDMGTGSGLAALQGSRIARGAWAVDITPRAAQYAEFNKRLNGADNLKILEGDLFAPVQGLTFDRIASNPPFEPPLKEGFIFSVGGEDGEAIIQRLVSESPAYLEPGGRLYCQVLGTDRTSDNFDQRIERWLGEHASECDLGLFVRESMKPSDYAMEQMVSGDDDGGKLEEWMRFYHRIGATVVVLGHLVLQRRESNRPVFRIRRDFGTKTGLAQIDWAMAMETRTRQAGFRDLVLNSPIAVGGGWELLVKHVWKEGRLQPKSYTFHSRYPFKVELNCSSSLAALCSRCDGVKTGADHFAWLVEKGALPETGVDTFIGTVEALVSCDVLRLPGLHPPEEPAEENEPRRPS